MTKLSPNATLNNAFAASPLEALVGKRAITRDDVAALRQSDLGFGLRSRHEAELMLTIERGRGEKCRAWGDFVVELMTDFVVWDQSPLATLTDEAALWLVDQIGDKPTPACLALLVSVAEDADTVPTWFVPAVRLHASRVFERKAGDGLRDAA